APRGAPADEPVLDEHGCLTRGLEIGRVNKLLPYDTSAVARARDSGAVEVGIDLQGVFIPPEDASAAEGGYARASFGSDIRHGREAAARFTDQPRSLNNVVVPVARHEQRAERWFLRPMQCPVDGFACGLLPHIAGISRLKASRTGLGVMRHGLAPERVSR